MDGATIEPLAPLLLLLNDLGKIQLTDNELNGDLLYPSAREHGSSKSVKKLKKRGPKI